MDHEEGLHEVSSVTHRKELRTMLLLHLRRQMAQSDTSAAAIGGRILVHLPFVFPPHPSARSALPFLLSLEDAAMLFAKCIWTYRMTPKRVRLLPGVQQHCAV